MPSNKPFNNKNPLDVSYVKEERNKKTQLKKSWHLVMDTEENIIKFWKRAELQGYCVSMMSSIQTISSWRQYEL